ncbi:hypothetical protein LTR37_007606 [Vermiconidia calcicola]|uniref:Uncharacterized protein n=1 Tax=Vermiconidia calcicola TaxID=1690605 RepID=A0ACC3NDG6_9PEZI|nr:hypothetical protein LTR37_007606 [Vermiconidia calcicola]
MENASDHAATTSYLTRTFPRCLKQEPSGSHFLVGRVDIETCSNCVHRGDIIVCDYALRDRQTNGKPPRSSAQPLDRSAQDKLDHLEQLVSSLLDEKRAGTQVATPASTHESGSLEDRGVVFENQQDVEHTDDSVSSAVVTGSGPGITLCGNGHKPRYSVDEAWWASLLNSINDVRAYLHAQHQRHEDQTKETSSLLQQTSNKSGQTMLFGNTRAMSVKEILSHLPSKHSCDIMIERFFAHLYPPLHILHRPTFRKQYARFWLQPRSTSIAWVGLLFAMLRIAMLDYLREGDEPVQWHNKCQDMAMNYRNRFTDCMIAADYLQPQEFLIEALCLHHYGEYVSTRDAKSSIWVLMGLITRLAMRMGYHQTSQPTLESTPFKDEMRRRVWAFIRQGDIMISFQLGLPAMVDLSVCDSNLPRNIYDDRDFSEDCTMLPPALPDSEPTEISFLLAKTRLAFGFARAAAEISKTPGVKWERILEIDREVRHIYDSIPGAYKLGVLSQQDSLILSSAKFTLANIHHKSLCIIHSRFLEPARSDHRYLYSRKICLSSAMSVLRMQAIQDQEIPVEGRMRSLTSYQTSLTIHDFLLAAAIISSDLCSGSSLRAPQDGRASVSGIPTRVDMIRALGVSAQIFGRMQDRSKEACRAADVLSMLVNKLEAGKTGAEDDNYNVVRRSHGNPGSRIGAQALLSESPTPSHQQRALSRDATGAAGVMVSGGRPDIAVFPNNISETRRKQQHSPSTVVSDPMDRHDLLPPDLAFEAAEFGLDTSPAWSIVQTRQPPSSSPLPSSGWLPDSSHAYTDWMEPRFGSETVGFGHGTNPADGMESQQWCSPIAMNDPLSTLWDLSVDLTSNAVFPRSH